jgi:ATP-dependent RNA helicase DHX37/DHR1
MKQVPVRHRCPDLVVRCTRASSQVPQFLYEAGYGEGGLIGITQPRRVAVTSTAQRVSYEMTSGLPQSDGGATKADNKGGKKGKDARKTDVSSGADGQRHGQLVGYQIRFDSSTVGPETRVKFMTDGILLKEVAADLLLRKYRVVILDEAHERNMNTDVLLGECGDCVVVVLCAGNPTAPCSASCLCAAIQYGTESVR